VSPRKALIAAALAIVGVGVLWMSRRPAERTSSATAATAHEAERQVRVFCASCHHLPDPALLPKPVWPQEIDRMYTFAANAENLPPSSAVKAWFVSRAPEHLPPPSLSEEGAAPKVHFKARPLGAPSSTHGISQATFVRGSSARPDILYADARSGEIGVLRRGAPARVFGRLKAPARVEPEDLDRDGHGDYVVADLGSFLPTNDRVGRVVWLRGVPKGGGYETVVLAEGLGRVADVRAADMDGDGDTDLVVAVFGWAQNGELLYLENRTGGAARPTFERAQLDGRSGATRLQIADMNRDGKPDIVVVMSQAYEEVIAWINQGGGEFTSSTIHETRHPDFGYSGLRVADMDADGDLDVLVTNGDATDIELLKPQHSVHLLENEGRYPFTPHRLAALPGAYDVAAGDLDGDGDQDVAAVAWLPVGKNGPLQRRHTPYLDLFNARDLRNLSAIVWLEQTSRLRFAHHTIETVNGDYAALDVGDADGDGDLDLLTGNLSMDGAFRPPELPPLPGAVTVWENKDTPRRDEGG
jgi:hypothetical protein